MKHWMRDFYIINGVRFCAPPGFANARKAYAYIVALAYGPRTPRSMVARRTVSRIARSIVKDRGLLQD